MKIGLIGLGYWGKIVLKNLAELGFNDIIICEQNYQNIDWAEIGSRYKVVKDYHHLRGRRKCDKIFVLTPATTHYDICKFFLEKGTDVFCEKPLDISSSACRKLYEIAKENKASLFVDWIFTFNPAVNKIKSLIKEWGPPKNITANRMNYGPARNDVDAKWDLASHDVSIVCYLLEEYPGTVEWLDFKRDKDSIQNDSTVGVLSFEDTCVQINASWSYGRKNRLYLFEFDDGILYWDDTTKSVKYGSLINDYALFDNADSINIDNSSPLHNSIHSFLNKEARQENLTLDVTSILEQ